MNKDAQPRIISLHSQTAKPPGAFKSLGVLLGGQGRRRHDISSTQRRQVSRSESQSALRGRLKKAYHI